MTDSERELFSRLQGRFSGDAYAVIPQVPNGTGGNKSRTADAIVMSLWPSRGLTLDGFEFKASRSDWLRELKTGEKAESIATYCDRWWIVAMAGVVKDGEMPDAWGLMVPHSSNSLKVAKKAKQTDAAPVDRDFLAGLLRASVKARKVVESNDDRRAYNRGYDEGKSRAHEIAKHHEHENERLKQAIKTFEDASGVRLNSYGDNKRIGSAVRAILSNREHHAGQFDRDARYMEQLAELFRTAATQLRNGTTP